MNNRKIIRLIFIFFIPMLSMLLTSCISIPREVKNMENNKEIIVEIANKTAKELGYNLSDMTISLDRDNSAWNKHISKGPFFEDEFGREIKKKLDNKKYWAVHYNPKRAQLGGDLFVFVDKETKEVITVIRGQ